MMESVVSILICLVLVLIVEVRFLKSTKYHGDKLHDAIRKAETYRRS